MNRGMYEGWYLGLTWYGNIDTDLTGFDISLESSGDTTIAREYSDAIAILVCVYEVDGIVEGRDVYADEDWAKDFFGVAAHMRFDVCDHCGADLQCVKMLGFALFGEGV